MPTAAEVSDALETAMGLAVIEVTDEGTSTDEVNTPIFRARMQGAYDAVLAFYFGTLTIGVVEVVGSSVAVAYSGVSSLAQASGGSSASATSTYRLTVDGMAAGDTTVTGIGQAAHKGVIAGAATVTASGQSASLATVAGAAAVTATGAGFKIGVGVAVGSGVASGSAPLDATMVTFVASPDHANVINYQALLRLSGNSAVVATQDLGVPTPNAQNEIVVSLVPLYAGAAPGTYTVSILTVTTGGSTDSGVSNAFTLPLA